MTSSVNRGDSGLRLSEIQIKQIEGVNAGNSGLEQIVHTFERPFRPGSLNERLVRGAYSGDIEDVQEVLSKGAALNALEIFRESGVSEEDEKEMTALHTAAVAGHVEIIKLLLGRGLNVDIRDSQGMTPLMYAAMKGYVLVVQLLLDQGAKVNVQNFYNITPLHFAVGYRHLAIVQLLLDHKANVNVGPNGRFPLENANAEDPEIIALLVDRGATYAPINHDSDSSDSDDDNDCCLIL